MIFLDTYFIGAAAYPLELLIWSAICLAIGFPLLYLSGDRPRLRTFKIKTVEVIAYSLVGIGAALFYIGLIWLFAVAPIIAGCLLGVIIIAVVVYLYQEARHYPKASYSSY